MIIGSNHYNEITQYGIIRNFLGYQTNINNRVNAGIKKLKRQHNQKNKLYKMAIIKFF